MQNMQRIVLVGLAGMTVLAIATLLPAQDDRDRDRDRARDAPRAEREGPSPREPSPFERRGQRDEGRQRSSDDEVGEGTEEGMPEAKIAPRIAPGGREEMPQIRVQRWRLGVYAVNTDTGVTLTRVIPNTAAGRAGLERRDRIVTVNGYQIGLVAGRLYPLGDELQRRADRAGRVTLLVQDHRTGDLVNMEIRLQRFGGSPWGLP